MKLKSVKQRMTLTFNVTSPIRREKLEGREHLVVPGVMMTVGVHEGSNGPFFYDEPDLEKACIAWNHKPIVMNHPTEEKSPTGSAAVKDVLEQDKVGILLNTRWDDKQRTEFWIDDKRLKEVNQIVYNDIQKEKIIEVSTGLDFDVETMYDFDFDGTHYDEIPKAINHRPDHIAILTNSVGACSVAKGAGLLQLNSERRRGFRPVGVSRIFSQEIRNKLAKNGIALKDGSFPIVSVEDLKNAINAVGNAKNRSNAKRHIMKRARGLGRWDLVPEEWRLMKNQNPKFKLTKNELSFARIENQLRRLLSSRLGDPGVYWDGWICDVYKDFVVFIDKMKTWMIGYSVSKTDKVALTGDPVEVVQVTEYKKASDGSYIVGNSKPLIEENDMATLTKKDKVSKLIKNEAFEEADRDWLSKQDEEKLDKLLQKLAKNDAKGSKVKEKEDPEEDEEEDEDEEDEKAGKKVVKKKTTKNSSSEDDEEEDSAPRLSRKEWLALAPPEWQDTIKESVTARNTQKKAAIKVITANAANDLTEEELNDLPLKTLLSMARLAKNAKKAKDEDDDDADFLGLGGAPDIVANAAGDDEEITKNMQPLVVPDMELAKHGAVAHQGKGAA